MLNSNGPDLGVGFVTYKHMPTACSGLRTISVNAVRPAGYEPIEVLLAHREHINHMLQKDLDPGDYAKLKGQYESIYCEISLRFPKYFVKDCDAVRKSREEDWNEGI